MFDQPVTTALPTALRINGVAPLLVNGQPDDYSLELDYGVPTNAGDVWTTTGDGSQPVFVDSRSLVPATGLVE